ncbi:MAG TPA: PQQ-binding-like beta-propeller repeat protein [Verrucomicrobiota bacterium]|nr:PQQ-binding-like beta-propeller repeat protein [Verrucomicrobiota bacterium]
MRTKKPVDYRRTLIGALCSTILVPCALADDWPQWQGPDRNAISKETGLLKEWPKDGPSLAWKIKGLGGGYSGASIAAGRIFGMSNRGEDEVVWALSEKDGKELWVARLGPAFNQRASQGREGPACTPTVDGERLYVEGLAGDVACLQVSDGKVLWQRSLTRDFGGRVPMWSYRESPLIDGDKVICTPGSEDAMLVALDKLTGKTIWKSSTPSGPSSGSGGAPSGGGLSGPGGRSGGAASVVTGTKDPGLFMGEHWGMRAFSCKMPNGKYLAKLYFAETYEGITGPGQRVFSLNVQGHEFKDFDIWVKAGGPRRAYIETVPVEVTNGEFRVVFTRQVENPAINAIEIVPQTDAATGAASSAAAIRIKAGLSAPFTDSSGEVWQPESGFEGGMMSQVAGGLGGSLGNRDGSPGSAGGFGRSPGGFGGFGGSGAAYASAIAIDFDGQRQYVQLTARALIGVAASDGKFLWRYDTPANRMGINCSTPIHHGGMVFAASAYGAGGGLLKLSKEANGGVKAEEVYATRRMQNHHGGMILLEGCLYGANGGNEGGALVCLDFKTGNVLWDRRDSGERRAKGSLALADGRLYYRTEDGAMLLIEPSPKEYIERGRFEQPDRSEQPAWTHPVIANGKLYLRDQDVLFCYDVKAR